MKVLKWPEFSNDTVNSQYALRYSLAKTERGGTCFAPPFMICF